MSAPTDPTNPTDPTTPLADDVLRDLVSLYLAGEASAGTIALVEAHLRERPDLAREVTQSSRLLASAGAPAGASAGARSSPPSPREPDLVALATMQMLLRRRQMSLGLGIFLALLPFSFYSNGGRPLILIRELPWLAVPMFLASAIAWWIFFRTRRRLRVAGF